MRRVGLIGIAVLVISMVVSVAAYFMGGLPWNPSDPGFLYSSVLALGFMVSIGAGLFGAIKESEEFLIVAGVACIVLTAVNKFFINRLYSWDSLDATRVMAGLLMILDRFRIKMFKEKKPQAQEPETLLDRFDKLISEPVRDGSDKAGNIRELYDAKKMLWLQALNKPELARALRGRLYLSKVGREIVERFVDKNLETIEPDIETARMPTYCEFVDIETYPQERVRATLDELAEANVLLKELCEKTIACPTCHEPSKVFIRNKCPKCNSHKVRMNKLFEHQCGAIYEKNQYVGETGLRCPKCQKPIESEAELKPVGVAFRCESCDSVFGDPVQSFHCRRCAKEFDLKECEFVDIHSYRLNPKVRSEAVEVLSVATLAETLEGLGYEVKVPGLLKGESAVNHPFTLVCTKGGSVMAIDVVTTEPDQQVDIAKVLPSFAKFMDVSVTTRLLLVLPGLDQQAREFLKSGQILSVEARNLNEVSAGIRKALEQTAVAKQG